MKTGMEMFLEKGYEQVQVMDICVALSITKPTFYRYVPSKENIVFECYAVDQKLALEKAGQLYDDQQYLKSLLTLLEAPVILSNRVGFQICQISTHGAPKITQPYKEQVHNLCQLTLHALKEQGLVQNPASSHTLAKVLLNLVDGMILSWCSLLGEFDLLQAAQKSISSVLGFDTSKTEAPAIA